MSKIKASAASSGPAVSAEKDLQSIRQQTEMKASEALIREMSKTAAEQRDNAQSDDKAPEQEQPRDTAELSSTLSRLRADAAGSMEELLKWMLEMAGKDWEAFLKWWPDPEIPLPDQLQELSRLYLILLESALKYAEGENLTEQLERLDSLLVQKLNLVMDYKLEQLTSLLEQTNETEALDSIRSSLYRQTAGRPLSPQAAHILFTQEPSSRHGRTSYAAASSSFPGEGMIYQPSRKQNIRFQQVYHTQQNSWKEQLRQRNEIISNARKGIVENTFRQAGPVSCTGKELEMANQFAAHISNSGNLFKNPGITARNDEITGLLAAVMSIKGQVYAGKSTQTSTLVPVLQNAVRIIIEHYLNRKGVTNVYYYTLTAYRQMKNPQKAIQSGQDYAFQRFREKQNDPVYQKAAPYSRECGFFRALLKKLSPEKEFALGTGILREDWKNFLHAIGTTPNGPYLSRMDRHSPWGVLAGIGVHHTGSNGNTAKILLGTTVLLLMGILAMIWFRPI